ncbi:MAG: hypothetical protein ONB16_08635 [candidate division KSB1 bacterium]|nr:hypothetical protein [candidate division KSB1 bacterium]MDZ7319102.1 hypothetical protein [candidate division KSB1 bacterium]MDZ7340315.1 hypothetical protein [candidate division KSB1 bacterium]
MIFAKKMPHMHIFNISPLDGAGFSSQKPQKPDQNLAFNTKPKKAMLSLGASESISQAVAEAESLPINW